jgi:hypothetical protein
MVIVFYIAAAALLFAGEFWAAARRPSMVIFQIFPLPDSRNPSLIIGFRARRIITFHRSVSPESSRQMQRIDRDETMLEPDFDPVPTAVQIARCGYPAPCRAPRCTVRRATIVLRKIDAAGRPVRQIEAVRSPR